MKIISPAQHGYLDYLTVASFLIMPTLTGLNGTAVMVAYALAIIHLAMTLVTDFPLGTVKMLPFVIHGWVERLVGPALVLLPFVFGFDGSALAYFIVTGTVIILLGLLTDYRKPH